MIVPEPDSDTGISEEILIEVKLLHAEVSRRADALAAELGSLLVCQKGCSDCCQDDLAVFPVEAEIIRRYCGPLLTFDKPHPHGKCAFLDEEGACRIYPWRPYVCRTQGLPLRLANEGQGDTRAVCSLNEAEFSNHGVDLFQLPVDQCWNIGEVESRLAGLQVQALGLFQETLPRVKLRELFKLQLNK